MHVTKHRTIDPACLENPRPEGAESGEHRFAIFVSSPNTFFRKVEGYSGLHLHRQVSYPTVTTGKLVENPKEEPEGMRESTRNFREKIHSKDRDPLHSASPFWTLVVCRLREKVLIGTKGLGPTSIDSFFTMKNTGR